MSVIVTRAGKGATLSWVEADANFTNLNNDKLEAGTPATNIAVTPFDDIAATDVQAALNEINDKIPPSDPIDASEVSYTPAGTGAVTTTVQSKLLETVSVKDFGAVGDGVTDDTLAIQTLLNLYGGDYEVPRTIDVEVLFPAGTYKVSSLTVPRRVNLRFLGSHLSPLDTTTSRTHLIKFAGRNKVTNLCINMDYAMNYDTVIWCRGRYIDFILPEIWRAKCVFVFGDPAWEGDAASGVLGDSEITLIGGNTAHCITHSRLYGQNTIVTFTGGHQAYSYKWSLPDGDPRKAAWEALPEITIINCGALLYLTGAFTGNFSGAQPNFLSKIQVVNDPAYVNSYGRFILSGSHIESGFYLYCESPGAVPIQDAKTKLLTMNACAGYISGGRGGYLIDTQNATQGVDIRASNFYGNVGNNIVYSVSGKVHVDEDSFESNATDFFQKLYAQNLYGYADYIATDVDSSTKSLSPTPSTIVFTRQLPSSTHSAYQELAYNTTTGLFTAITDLRKVSVNLLLAFNAGSATDITDVIIYINGNQWRVFSYVGSAVNLNTVIPKLPKGSTIRIDVAQYQSRALYGGRASGLTISACN